ncbi:MAG: hypothetical protein WD063_19100 [Pirellulales bacterium]
MASELNQFLRDRVDGKNLPFTPYCDIGKDADVLTVFYKPDPYYSKRLTDHVTLYLALEPPHGIVGCRIKGIAGLLLDLPNYIAVDHGGIKLSLIFLSFRGGTEDEQIKAAFNELAKAAGDLELSSAA